MAHPMGESKDGVLKLDFDRRLMLQFCGSVVTSDAGLLAYRELDDALGLSAIAGETLADARTGKNSRTSASVRRSIVIRSQAIDGRSAPKCQGKWPDQPPTTVRAARCAGGRPHLAAVLQEGRKYANIHARLGNPG